MKPIEIVSKKYAERRYYNPSYDGPFLIEDWILIEEQKGWIKGAEKINEKSRGYRIRFVYWELKDKDWRISRLHPIMDTRVVKELFDEMRKKKWI